jgi:uncharacterized protein
MPAGAALGWPEGWDRIEAAVTRRATRASLESPLHGPRHWRVVAMLGAHLAYETPGVDYPLVVLFALLHDCRRLDDGRDPGHGHRAAALVRKLAAGGVLRLAPDRLARLELACALHADGYTHADPTVGTCWDADRLGLGRVGITPDPRLLSTAAARLPDLAALGTRAHLGPPRWASLRAAVTGGA